MQYDVQSKARKDMRSSATQLLRDVQIAAYPARATAKAAHRVFAQGVIMKSLAILASAVAATGLWFSQPALAQPATEALGKVHFETSCTPEAAARL